MSRKSETRKKQKKRRKVVCPFCGLTYMGKLIEAKERKKKTEFPRKSVFLSKSRSLTFKCIGCGKIVVLHKFRRATKKAP